MCQALGTCYEETRESPLRAVIGNTRRYLLYHPGMGDAEIMGLIDEQCSKNSIRTADFLGYVRQNLERTMSLAVDMSESEPVRSLQKAVCKFYGTVLGAFGNQN